MRFQFEGVAGQGVTVEFADFAFGFLLRLTVYQPDGTVLIEGPAQTGQYLAELPATGTYLVTASPYASTGTATLMLWRHTDGGLVVDGASGSAAIDAGEAFVFDFDAEAGQRLGFGTSGWSLPSSGRLRVFVLDPSDSIYTASNLLVPQSSTFEFTVATTGVHRLFIAAADNVSTGSVTATLSTERDAGALTVGGSRAVTFDRPGRPIRLHFDGTAGAQRQLAFSNFTVMFLPNVTVYRPDGTVLTQNPSALTMNFTLPVTGTYDVVLTDYSSTGSLTASLSSGAPTAAAAPADVSEGAVPTPVTDLPRRTGSDTAIPAAGPAPESVAVPAARDVSRPGIEPTRPMREPLRAPDGITAVSGEIRTVDDRPLPGVTVQIGHRRTGTDQNGQFLLVGVPAGQQTLVIDRTRAGADDVSYGSYDVGVRVAAGETTVLPQVSWLTPLDTGHTVELDSPTDQPVVLTHPDVPGLEVHLPAGTTVRDRAGEVVTELGITPIRVDRPPFPLPGFPVPVYFTVQPGGVSLSGAGAQIVYPNYTGAPAGAAADFWHYAPEGRGWYRYGYGHVTADGTQVVPEEYVRLHELTGAMINDPAQPLPPEQAPPPGGNSTGGDPVDLATGLMVERHTDLWLDDVLPVGVSRTYRQGDPGSHSFGVGTALDEFGLRLFSVRQWEDAALILPDGGRVQFNRITPGVDTFEDAVFAAEATPTQFQGSILAWNGNGWDLRLRDGLTYVFGDEAPLQSIRDPYGNTITITRAPGVPVGDVVRANGPITQITSPSGKWVRFSYDDENRITLAEDNLGRTVGYAYHDEGALEGNLARVTDPAGGVTEYGYETYQEDGFTRARLASITDPRGITYLENEYDAAGRVAVQTQADGTTYEFAYTETGGRVSRTVLTDPRGVQRRVDFDANGYAVGDTAAVGTAQEQPLLIERDAETHRPTATVDALGRRTETAYDANGNPSAVTRLAGTAEAQTFGFVHDGPRDQLTQVTDPLGNVTTLSYRDDGALAAVTDPVGRTTTFEADSAGRFTAVVDPLGNATTVDYQVGDLVSVTDALGRATRLAADTAGRVTAVTDPAGNTTRYAHDALNLTRSVTDPLGHVTTLDYDPNGNLTTVTDPRGNSTDYVYGDMDRIATRTDPLGRVESYSYDADGNLTEVDNRRGNRTEYVYDPLGRLIQARYGVTSTGQESQVDYTHDAGDRLTNVDDSTSGLLEYVLDDLDRLVEETSPAGTVSYGYDAGDRRTTMTVAGQDPVTYGYNDAGDLLTVLQSSQQVTHSYDDAGRLDAIELPGGWGQDYSYDPADQLTGIAYLHSDAVVGDLVYGYNLSGERELDSGSWSRTPLPEPFGPATYDAANQLTSVNGVAYAYDADGNLTDDGTLTYGYNARNQLVDLTTAANTATFTYDGIGRRATATIDGSIRGYLYDEDNPVQELDVAGQPTANLLTGGLDVYYARTTTAGTDTYLTDVLGSTIGLGDSAGTRLAEYAYEPFGATTLTGDDHGNRHQYTGRENDGTGLYHYRERYYHPGLQRFTTEDPLGFAAGDTNLYAYASNQPTEYIDPYGLKPQPRYGGEATVSWDPDEQHAIITVRTSRGEALTTEQVVLGADETGNPSGYPTTGRVASPLGPNAISKTFSLPNADAAMRAQRATIGADLGRYGHINNSCVTYCVDILRKGGLDIPAGARGAVWLKRLL
jgi:RHS repeat-associated protein